LAKNIIPTLQRAKNRIERVLRNDELRLSRGSTTDLNNAITDLIAALETETERQTVPEGCVRLSVNMNLPTAEALKECRVRQKSGGNIITITETVRRAIAIYKYVLDEQEAGRMIVTMDSNGKKAKELVLS
jgi:hypothetical protein